MNPTIISAHGYRLLRVWYQDYEWDHDDTLPVLAFGLETPDQIPTVFTPTGDTLVDGLADSHAPAKSPIDALRYGAGYLATALLCPDGTVIDPYGSEFGNVESYVRSLQTRELYFSLKAARRRVGFQELRCAA